MKSLQGKVAVVTGASEGIGKAISQSLARRGCKVALLARSEEKLARVVEEIVQEGGEARAFPGDLRNLEGFAGIVQEIEKELGPVAILVNNVGSGTFRPLEETGLQEVIEPVYLPIGISLVAVHALVPRMMQQGEGHVVNITSPAGYFPLPYMLPYATARHAINGLSLSLREELAGHNIGVSLVCPPKVNTGYFERNQADMGWFPKISAIFPTVEPEVVGEKVVTAIVKNKREVIFPFLVYFFVRCYQKFPRLNLFVLKVTGLFAPGKRK